MVKKFSEFTPVNEDLSTNSSAPHEEVPVPSGASPAPVDIERDVTSTEDNPKAIASEIGLTMKELEKMFFDAHTRIKNQDLGDKPLLEIQAADGHTIKIMLHR